MKSIGTVISCFVLIPCFSFSAVASELSGRLLFQYNESPIRQTPTWAIRDFGTGKTLSLPMANNAVWTSLSADGRLLAFTTAADDKNVELHAGSWESSQFRSIRVPQWQVRDLTWTPDNAKILLDYGAFDLSLGTFTSYGLNYKKEYRFSPDQKKVALFFYSNNTDIDVIAGTTTITIKGANHKPIWSRQSDAIAFTRDQDLFVYDLISHRETQITHFKSGAQSIGGISFSPDGKMLAFCRVYGENVPRMLAGTYSSIYVIRRDGGGLKRLFYGNTPNWASND